VEVIDAACGGVEDFPGGEGRGVDGQVAFGVWEGEGVVPDEGGGGVFVGVEVEVGVLG